MASKRSRREREECDRRVWCLCTTCCESPAWRGQPLHAVPLVHKNTVRYHLLKRQREGPSNAYGTPAWPYIWLDPRDVAAFSMSGESLWPPTQLYARSQPHNVPTTGQMLDEVCGIFLCTYMGIG